VGCLELARCRERMSLGNMEQSRQQKLMRSTQADEGKVAMIGLGRGTAVRVRSQLSSQAGAVGVGLFRPTQPPAGRNACISGSLLL
jgi:hypothetical protein